MKTEQIKYIWEVSHGQRGRILLSCLTGIIGVAVSLAFIYASKVVIDIATGAAIGSLTNAAILTIALLIAQLLCGAVDTWLSARMQVETGNALRHRLFSRLLQSRWNELERFHTGDIVNRVEQDTAAIVGGTDQYNSGFHSYHRSVGSRIRILLLSRSVPALGNGRHSTYFPIG